MSDVKQVIYQVTNEKNQEDIPSETNDQQNKADDNLEPEHKHSVFSWSKANWVDIWIFGVTIAVGGQLYGWNSLLTVGFGTWTVASCFMGLAFIFFICCISEIGAAFNFPGGAYRLVRVTIGMYPGWIVGAIEYTSYVMMISTSVNYLGSVFVSEDFLNCDPSYSFLIWLLFYAVCLAFTLPGGRVMLSYNMILGVPILILIAIYCFGSLKYVSFNHYAPLTNDDDYYNSGAGNATSSSPLPLSSLDIWFVGGMEGFMSTLSLTTCGYAGVESLALMSDITYKPKKSLPTGQVAAAVTLFVCFTFITFVACSLPPGLYYTSNQDYFMSAGYKLIFNCSDMVAILMIIPGQIGMAWGFFVPGTKLFLSMCNSKLIPPLFGHKWTYTSAMLFTCAYSLLFCIISFYVPAFGKQIQNISVMGLFIMYLSQLYVFYQLRTKYSGVTRDWISPFGLSGASLATLMFTLGMVSTSFYQDDDSISLIVCVGMIMVYSLYYYKYAKDVQCLSKDEEKSLFKLYVINHNFNKTRKRLFSSKSRGSVSKGSANGRSSFNLRRSLSRASSSAAFGANFSEFPAAVKSFIEQMPNVTGAARTMSFTNSRRSLEVQKKPSLKVVDKMSARKIAVISKAALEEQNDM